MRAITCDGFNFSLNLLVIISLINYRRTRRHVTTPFIISLSVLDLVYAGISLPVLAARFANRESPLSQELCELFPVIFYGTLGASLFTLTMVSLLFRHQNILLMCPPGKIKVNLCVSGVWWMHCFPVAHMFTDCLTPCT